MAREQTLTSTPIVQSKPIPDRPKWAQPLPPPVHKFIDRWIESHDSNNLVLLVGETMDEQVVFDGDVPSLTIANHVICLKPLNDIKQLTRFLRCVNESMEKEGCLIGKLETTYLRKMRILATYPWLLNRLIYLFDYLIFRVWPKMPYVRHAYFRLLGGQRRVLSEMEALGRLYFCGFTFLDTVIVNGTYYFAVKKIKPPVTDRKPTVGPFIRLRRNGGNEKIIHVYKLRTMFPYAEFLQQYVYEQQGLADGGKIEKDPRVNAAGFILRKYWLDELPMIINLMKGDLKIVGVRPLSKQYFSLYPKKAQEYRQKFKPGLLPPFYADLPKTFDEIVASEMRYLQAYERKPLLTDLRVLCKAIYNIVFRMARSK